MRAGAAFVLGVLLGAAPAGAQAPERIAEIRVHGNHTTPDADILALSRLAIGDDAAEARLRDVARALRASGRFDGVEVRRRYLSIADPSQILIVIVVHEHPAVTAHDLTPGGMKKVAAAGMWLPILRHEDGYGLTYGARYSFIDSLGDRSRMSVPLTWGGERRAGLELERLFDRQHVVLRGGLSVHRRVNPHFELSDTRREGRVEAQRILTDWAIVGAGARVAHVAFGDAYDARHTAGGAHVVIDTRIDPSFPRNAAHVRLGWERLAFQTGRSHLWQVDARGYLGIGGSRVLAVRTQLAASASALPAAEQRLLGGGSSLRGYRAGYRAGDNLAAATLEIRQPLNPPMSVGRFGVKTFIDAGTTWLAGERLADGRFDRGVGGGLYFGAGPFMLDVDVAWPETGSARTHVGIGLAF